ncbi:MAG: hypothetical protein JW798_11555 [Prolixibacteraceae bacterium]|nr:hypothetical protein [Prolixibacteraceae bacterium]
MEDNTMAIRYFFLTVNILFFAGSSWWFFSILFNLFFKSETFETIRLRFFLAAGLVILSLVSWIIRKSLLPVPGIDYK